ncbi:MAG TPA: beta-ketoacyl synthase chain length factor [Rhodanobacteraceae bacterium]|nr:beta-ketoacyl synthase chain length factor [Rhodanobacteraceae bacterium]
MNGKPVTALNVWVEGIGAWAPGIPDWAHLRALLRDQAAGPDAGAPARPTPAALPPGERRRAPVGVLIAIEAAAQAVAMSGRDAATLPCIFASAHGDAGIMDYMCATLAQTPREMSPTRFHNSVHNAAAGYWTIAAACHAASTAVSARAESFGASLLEAAVQVAAEGQAVLLVASDVPGAGPLGEMIDSTEPFGCALVLAPAASAATVARLDLFLHSASGATAARHPHAQALAATNLSARGLPLLEALAAAGTATLDLPASPTLGLTIHTEVNP